MSVVESGTTAVISLSTATAEAPKVRSAPLGRVVMRWVRRSHLYLGLFLFPWAVLYGVTAFLFNHPNAFSDQPGAPIGRELLIGTPMETPPSPSELAGEVVEALRKRAKEGAGYALVDPDAARFTRDFAFGTARTVEGEQISVLLDIHGGGGTIRAQPTRTRTGATEPAPFAFSPQGKAAVRGRRAGQAATTSSGAGGSLGLSATLNERVKSTITTVLERSDYSGEDVVVTSVPDLTFRMQDADGTVWSVTYHAMAGSVSGKKAEDEEPRSLGVRRFLLRMHLAHGYPSSLGARWFWALIVDAMAFVMVFWAVSGLFMWWQIKATREWGALTLVSSAAFAVALAWGMYRVFVA